MKEIEGENGKEHLMETLVHYCMIILSGHECWLSFLIVAITLLSTRFASRVLVVRACISVKQSKNNCGQ